MNAMMAKTAPPASLNAPDALLLGFARALRAAGLPITADREAGFLKAVAVVGLDDEVATYWAGRATLCGNPDDIARFDQIFASWFTPPPARFARGDPGGPAGDPGLARRAGGRRDGDREADSLRASASATEVLRHRDVAQMSPAEKAALMALFGSVRRPDPRRRTSRSREWHRGEIDARRTLRRRFSGWGSPVGWSGDVAAPIRDGWSCSSTCRGR